MAAAILAAILAFPCYGISAEKAVLLDGNTGRILYEKNPDSPALIASTTKIMTALIICEQCNVLDRVRIPKEAVGVEGSSIYLREGEVLTVQELLYGMMLHSGNDAATALAIYCGGTVEAFSQLMNDKAHRLGLINTHFENPHGLDSPNHYSTARDLAILSAYAMNNPIFRQTVSTKTIKIGERALRNHNKLLWHFDGCNGVKTGYTKKAGRILVSAANRDGRQLVAVTINAPDDWEDHRNLLIRGFHQFEQHKIIEKDSCVAYIPVACGVSSYVKLLSREDAIISLAKHEEAVVILQEPGFVYAPVTAGDDAGYAYVMIGNYMAAKVPLYYGETIFLTQEKTHIYLGTFESE